MDKPNCYKCKHRGTVLGSAHSSCNHPAFSDALNDPLGQLMSIFGSVGRVPPVRAESDVVKVVGNPHGIRMGWFQHPYNFDPVWLKECSGFSAKDAA